MGKLKIWEVEKWRVNNVNRILGLPFFYQSPNTEGYSLIKKIYVNFLPYLVVEKQHTLK